MCSVSPRRAASSAIQVFFFRSGQNWGNRAYFPRADRTLEAGEVLASFLAQFYDDKPAPKLILLSHETAERPSSRKPYPAQPAARSRSPCRSAARRRRSPSSRSSMRARRWPGASWPNCPRSRSCWPGWRGSSGWRRRRAASRCYDNSHIQGSDAVGAMIVAGPEGFMKTSYRKFNIRSQELAPAMISR